MKKLFTLLGVVLMASSAFGQTNWKNIVVNGDFESEVPAYDSYVGMAADASLTMTTSSSFKANLRATERIASSCVELFR